MSVQSVDAKIYTVGPNCAESPLMVELRYNRWPKRDMRLSGRISRFLCGLTFLADRTSERIMIRY